MNRAAIRPGAQACALGQARERFQDMDHGLRRLQMPRVDFDNLRLAVAAACRVPGPAAGSAAVASWAKIISPIALGRFRGCVAKTFSGGDVEQRHGLKWNEQPPSLPSRTALRAFWILLKGCCPEQKSARTSSVLTWGFIIPVFFQAGRGSGAWKIVWWLSPRAAGSAACKACRLI